MRLAIGFLLAGAAGLFGQNLYSLRGNTGYGTAWIPSGAPWNSLANIRFEFRIHDWTGAGGRLLQWDGFVVNLSGSTVTATSFYDPGTPTVSVTAPAGVTDIVVRLQRTPSSWQIELWSATGGDYLASYVASTNGAAVSLASTSLALLHNGGGGTTGPQTSMGWFRVFSTVVGPDSAPPDNNNGGNLLEYRLENGGVDSSGNNLPLSMGGTVNWVSTPVVPMVGEPRTVRAGHAFTLDCGGSNAASYFWQQLSGPQPLTFSSRTAAVTQAAGADTFGEYVVQCTVTNSLGQRGSGTVAVGAVATNDSGVVIPPSADIGFLTGEMLRSGSSPWPFYDRNRPRRSLKVGAMIVQQMGTTINTPLAGTISVANGSAAVTGTGTQFLSQYAANAQILLYYDQGGGKIGRQMRRVSSVSSNTSLTLTAAWDKSSQTAIQHQRWGTGDGADADSEWIEGYNYYDNILTLYVSYYKTGLSQLAAYADQMAQYWWFYTDLGQRYMFAPRHVGYEGLMLAARRGVLNADEVFTYADNYNWSWTGGVPPGYRNYITDRNTSVFYQNLYFGARESGYSWRWGVALGQQHPSPATRSAWQSRLAVNIQNYFRDFQCKASNPAIAGRCRYPEGAFRWGDDSWSPHLLELPWHTGIAMQGIIRYHRWTGNSVAQSILTDWVNHLMVNTQPSGAANYSLYQSSFASSFPGVNCRRHYYWHQRGTETTLLSTGGEAGGGCGGGADAVYGGRDTNNEIVSSYGYAYRLTGSAAIKARGDDVFGATWGADDGFFGQWAWGGAPNQGKTHGQGLCCNDSYLVDRLGPAAADRTEQPLPVRIGFRLLSVPGAASARVSVIRPDGVVTSAQCSVSPCEVSGDRQQGEHRVRLEYLAAGGAVLAVTEPQPLRVAP